MVIKKNVFSYFDKASIFLLSSISEGMNLSMIEAIKYGLPVVSSNCSLSHKEIIIHNKNGFLFNNQSDHQLINYLSILIKSENKRKKFGESSIRISKKFKNSNILKKWEKLVKTI